MPTCSTKCRARGLSLIEVMLGMAILGLFLTSIFIAQARLIRQSVIAKNKANVITAVDALLASWTLDWQNLPAEDTGTFPGHDQWQWQTHLADDPQWAELGLQKVELTVTENANDTVEPLLKMELALAIPRPEDQTQTPDEPSDKTLSVTEDTKPEKSP